MVVKGGDLYLFLLQLPCWLIVPSCESNVNSRVINNLQGQHRLPVRRNELSDNISLCRRFLLLGGCKFMYRLSEWVDQSRRREHLHTSHSIFVDDDVANKDANGDFNHFELAHSLAYNRCECLSDGVFDFNVITLGNAFGHTFAYRHTNAQRDHI